MREISSSMNQHPISPRIGIYMGMGASHSWLWFVDLLERTGLNDVHFMNEKEILAGALEGVNVLLMSGGDTFAIARGLGAVGAGKLKEFLERGGLYIGTCAGAYLPLRSSMDSLNQFNFINLKISNISRRLSDSEKPLFQENACSPYGCDFVYHVVREEVLLEMEEGFQSNGCAKVIAPLYGGPVMLLSDDIQPLSTYRGFTKKTKFLVGENLASKTLIGNIAGARKSVGNGWIYIFGPHFEHPGYPEANRILAHIILMHGKEPTAQFSPTKTHSTKVGPPFFEEWRRELSHSRMVAYGLEMLPLRWKIGSKEVQPEKIRFFLEALWKRLKVLESGEEMEIGPGDPSETISGLKGLTGLLRTIKKEQDRGRETDELADALFGQLKKVSSDFLAIYFRAKRTGSIGGRTSEESSHVS